MQKPPSGRAISSAENRIFSPLSLKFFIIFIHLCLYSICLLPSKSNSLIKLILILPFLNMVHLNFRYSPSLFTVTVAYMFCLEKCWIGILFSYLFASLFHFLVSFFTLWEFSSVFTCCILKFQLSYFLFQRSYFLKFSLNSLFLLHRCNNLICLKMTIN